jgi:hypothetical protein
MKQYFWPYVVLVIRRQRCGLSIYRFLKWTWYVDFCGNGDSTQTLCYYHSKEKEQANNETLYYFYLHCKCIFFNMQR